MLDGTAMIDVDEARLNGRRARRARRPVARLAPRLERRASGRLRSSSSRRRRRTTTPRSPAECPEPAASAQLLGSTPGARPLRGRPLRPARRGPQRLVGLRLEHVREPVVVHEEDLGADLLAGADARAPVVVDAHSQLACHAAESISSRPLRAPESFRLEAPAGKPRPRRARRRRGRRDPTDRRGHMLKEGDKAPAVTGVVVRRSQLRPRRARQAHRPVLLSQGQHRGLNDRSR